MAGRHAAARSRARADGPAAVDGKPAPAGRRRGGDAHRRRTRNDARPGRAGAEGPRARAIRLDSFLTFYGPGGFATPDDVEALESVQQGLAAWREVPWSVMTRGMAKEGEQLNTDELHLREFWIEWDRRMRSA